MATKTSLEAQNDFCGTFFAAKLLGLSVGTVQSLVERGELEAWKTKGGHRRISLQSVRDYQTRNGLQTQFGVTSQGLLKVLVVDDDQISLELIRTAVNKWQLPLDCTVMPSAMEALIDINSLRPQVLLTDLNMPGVDGFALLKTLRSNPVFAHMVLVAVTAMPDEDIAKRGGLPEHTVLVRKPLDMHWLHGFMTALVADRQLKNVEAVAD
jgi:excisionase family DNA binding protein